MDFRVVNSSMGFISILPDNLPYSFNANIVKDCNIFELRFIFSHLQNVLVSFCFRRDAKRLHSVAAFMTNSPDCAVFFSARWTRDIIIHYLPPDPYRTIPPSLAPKPSTRFPGSHVTRTDTCTASNPRASPFADGDTLPRVLCTIRNRRAAGTWLSCIYGRDGRRFHSSTFSYPLSKPPHHVKQDGQIQLLQSSSSSVST